jgi:hypothetical protein
MPVIPHLESIAAIAEQSKTVEQFSLALRDFLDGFYENPGPFKLSDEPTRVTEILHDENYADAYLAALAEHLARQFGFSVPAWCQNPERVLKKPVFAFNSNEGRMFLLVESPTAFRSRNIFISGDALIRV